MNPALQSADQSSLLLPVQVAIAELLSSSPLLTNVRVLDERPGELFTKILIGSYALQSAIVVFPPLIRRLNPNVGGGQIWVKDLEIRIEVSTLPAIGKGLGIYALVERVVLVLSLAQICVGGEVLNPLVPDENLIQPVRHPTRQVFHIVFHADAGLTQIGGHIAIT